MSKTAAGAQVTRSYAWVMRNAEHGYGVLEIRQGERATRYFCQTLEPGRRYTLAKLALNVGIAREYEVDLGDGKNVKASCSCDCFLHTKACKHADVMKAVDKKKQAK